MTTGRSTLVPTGGPNLADLTITIGITEVVHRYTNVLLEAAITVTTVLPGPEEVRLRQDLPPPEALAAVAEALEQQPEVPEGDLPEVAVEEVYKSKNN